jgi:ankyrin repeat protein
VNGGDNNGFTPLMWATQNNQAACVQRLLQNGASVNVSSADGWTALFDAAMSGSLEAAKVRRFACFTGTKLCVRP